MKVKVISLVMSETELIAGDEDGDDGSAGDAGGYYDGCDVVQHEAEVETASPSHHCSLKYPSPQTISR